MTGEHRVVVQTRRLKYEFILRRNITVIRGDSGTGKTTLVRLLAMYANDPNSGVDVQCDKKCIVYNDSYNGSAGDTLSRLKDSIIFIDEGQKIIYSKEFASIIKGTDNYYVLITRDPLKQLPYSISEIYGIRESSRYGGLNQTYNEIYNLYQSRDRKTGNKVDLDLIITEDSNSGYEFFKHYCDMLGIRCVSAKGKSNILTLLGRFTEIRNVLAIVDGAAFGPEMEAVMKKVCKGDLKLYAPESFEWLLLKSGVVKEVPKDVLENPAKYIESSEYFSWEQYFASVITKVTEGTPYKYSKHRLNRVYLLGANIRKVIRTTGFLEMPKM